MKETWRWYGPYDNIPLADIRQTGAQGIVTALHDIPYGQVWPRDAIAARKDEISAAGLTWDVVESLPVHEDIKRGTATPELFANYRQSLANLAAEGIRSVCYNFMPVLDWTRTALAAPVIGGGTCLRFEASHMAAFEIHMVGKEAARQEYHPDAVVSGDAWFASSTQNDRDRLLDAIMSGLPGAFDRYDIAGLRRMLGSYNGMTRATLRAHLAHFLSEVAPTAAELGITLAIHPDDPPRDILGLPRIVSSADDLAWIIQSVDLHANGLTLCSGSLGAHPENDVPAIASRFADRIHFAHLRNVRKDLDGSFEEAAHLDGDVDMVALVKALLEAEERHGNMIPWRPDHGHELIDDDKRENPPGYPLIGRMRGLAEIRGVIHAMAR
ncbi:MAG: mannonate dehydratase [Pseudomonadota bacterium]